MEKNLKDYLHLYIGCDVQYPDTDGKLIIATLTGVSRADGVETTYKKKRFKKGEAVGDYLSWTPNGHHNSNALHLKLILRPLSDMTDEEAVDMKINYRGNGIDMMYAFTFWQTKVLLACGFDLFRLIPAGLAIDKTTLKRGQNQNRTR